MQTDWFRTTCAMIVALYHNGELSSTTVESCLVPLGQRPLSPEVYSGISQSLTSHTLHALILQLIAFRHRKIPWRLSTPQKRRQRKRLRLVDNVVATVDNALKKHGMQSTTKLERWKEEMPTEAEMRPKDKYTIFDRKEKRYRKGIHSR